ncbi:lipase 2 [Rhodosporidiobolus nylandii]
MSLLSLFAGKKSVSDAHATQAEVALSDAIDTALLDEADLQELQRRVREIPTPSAMEADEVPAKEAGGGGAAAKAASFLPSLWAAPTAQKSSEKAKASLARITDHAVASEAKSPATLLSSFTLSNPFTSSSTSAGSLFSMAPFASSSSRPSSRSHTRSFSSSSMSRRRSTGSADMDERPAGKHGDEQGSELGKNHVKGMVDELDRQAVEEGVEENDDMYAVLKDKYTAPRLPVVFCHGLFGFDHIGPASLKPLRFSYWVGVEEALQAMGAEVMIGRVPASASVEERAKVLCEMIEERFPGREVNLVGHSMGGLDGRYLISRLKPKSFTVRSLTTISTPHRGSSFADFLLEDILGAEKVPSFLALMRGLGVPGGGKAFDDLTTTKMARFNEDTPDDPNVKYYSYGAEFTASWSNPFYIPFGIIRQREGPNDGLVSVSSAQWGEYRATLHNVNHLDLVGWVGKVRYGFAELMGRPIKFKPISFYCAIAEQLAEEGF